MSEFFTSNPGPAALALAQRVDEVCARFELALRSVGNPRIEDYLSGASETERLALLHELIPLEVEYRCRQAEAPQPEEYLGRFPSLDPQWLASAMAAPGTPSPPKHRLPGRMEPAIPRRLGDFEVIRELGRGGMGVVYEARQVSLNRKVALKVLGGGLGLTPKAVQRFRREAEAAAKLHHTNIVPVYATGEQDGTHFYAMELIEGPSLDHVIRQLKASGGKRPASGGRQPPGPESHVDPKDQGADAPRSPELEATGPYVAEAGPLSTLTASSLSSDSSYFDTVARMIAEVADALEYAHQQGVIHRDLKPSNLLLSPAGRLSINDFGLARMLEQPGMTLTGELVGTPAYMSPEQITAGRAPLNHRTDIYSLGATLYEMLTLQRPFTGERRDEVIAQIMHKEPKAPRRVNRKVPVDLETICLKCLEKDPDRRYQTAGGLAEDLRRYVNRFTISARRAGPVGRLVKWIRRRPALAVSLGCLLLAVGAALALGYWAHHEKQQRQDEQDRALAKLLDEKIHRAYIMAMNGDLDKTDEAIKEIEELGVSTGHLHLLRGMVAHSRGNAARAISELKQAVELLPESVAAHAMLATAYGLTGQSELRVQLFKEMEGLRPSSAEDYLFMGHAQELAGKDGIANMDQGIQLRASAQGFLLRGLDHMNRAYATGNLNEAEESVEDVAAARRIMPENPDATLISIGARVIAAMIYQEAKLFEKCAAKLKEAGQEVRGALDRYGDDLPSNLLFVVWYFYEMSGEQAKALAFAKRWQEKPGQPMANFCAIDHYHLGQCEEALQCLGQRQQLDPQNIMLRAIVLAESPGGPQRLLEEFQKKDRNLPESERWVWRDMLLFLGEKEKAVAIYQKRPEPDPNQSREVNEFADAEWLFVHGKITEDQYLAKAGAHRGRQSDAHWQIALFHLAAGDRDGARQHFQLGARPCWGGAVFWCQMLHGRMKKDETWPKWISRKR